MKKQKIESKKKYCDNFDKFTCLAIQNNGKDKSCDCYRFSKF